LRAAEKRVREAASGVDDASVRSFQCDFAVLDEVRQLAAKLREAYPRIQVLANNAGGVVSVRRTTVDGYEATIQTNHLAPFLLSHELREQVRGGRIINTSSGAHTQGNLDPKDLSSLARRQRAFNIYGSAKQANILFAAEAARRWPDIVSTSYHPGVVRTNFGNDSRLYTMFYRYVPGLRTPARGAATLVWLATVDRDLVRSGAYYVDERERQPSAKARDAETASALWEASLRAVGESW
jgi:NAD(P)-dependent dehydrogenase (short-subunit alcohol dehydrogenase family)